MGTQPTSHSLSGFSSGLTAYPFPLTEALVTSCSHFGSSEDAYSNQGEEPKTP